MACRLNVRLWDTQAARIFHRQLGMCFSNGHFEADRESILDRSNGRAVPLLR